jgi:hypothetical protein
VGLAYRHGDGDTPLSKEGQAAGELVAGYRGAWDVVSLVGRRELGVAL